MGEGGFFFQALVYLTAAVVAVPIASRLGLGSVLGYLLGGDEGRDVLHCAELGVVMMLFLIGLELEPARIWRLRGPILGLGGLQVGVTTLLLAGIGLALGLGWPVALAIGLILSLSSTAIVLQTLNEKGLLRTEGGQRAFSVLLFQDIAVIPILALLPLLASSRPPGRSGHVEATASWAAALPAWAEPLVVPAAVLVIVVAGRYLLGPALRFVARSGLHELFVAAGLLLVVATAMLMSSVGVSPALGTFLAGVVLARSEFRHELESDIEPFKGLLLGLFFISVGAAIDFGLIAERSGLVLALVAGLIAAKLLVLLVLGRVFRMSLDQSLLLAFSLAQGGEFAFVLFSYAVAEGVVADSLAATLIAAVALSMAATPLLMLLNERLIQPRFGTRESETRAPDAIDEDNPVIIAGFGSFGSIVGRLLRANGVGATVLDNDSDRVDLLRKLGLRVFYGDATRADLLHAAGAARAKVIVLALDEPEKNLELVRIVRRRFPQLVILARAPSRWEAFDLLDAGVERVYRERLDTSLRLGTDVLRLLGRRAYQAHRAALTFRRHDERSVRELARTRHDPELHLDLTRRSIRDLETLLLADLGRRDETRDMGWDTESLREEFGEPDGA
jgi:monovalent cation:proton antiporter-2 (CPA2) family protein